MLIFPTIFSKLNCVPFQWKVARIKISFQDLLTTKGIYKKQPSIELHLSVGPFPLVSRLSVSVLIESFLVNTSLWTFCYNWVEDEKDREWAWQRDARRHPYWYKEESKNGKEGGARFKGTMCANCSTKFNSNDLLVSEVSTCDASENERRRRERIRQTKWRIQIVIFCLVALRCWIILSFILSILCSYFYFRWARSGLIYTTTSSCRIL